MRVLAVADADSYLKWSAANLDRLPADWQRRQVLLVSPIAPSPNQALAATGHRIEAGFTDTEASMRITAEAAMLAEARP